MGDNNTRKPILKSYAVWGCVLGIVIARIISKSYGNTLPENIGFLITALLPSAGILIGVYLDKRKGK